MAGAYEHLELSRWPFPVVPERDFCTFLAGRKQVQTDVEELLQHLSRRDTSSIHLFWAWFGAGKTHTLFYLANQAALLNKRGTGNVFQCVYSEFPKSSKGFVDLYKTFIGTVDFSDLADAYLEVCTSSQGDGFAKEFSQQYTDLASALQVLATGDTANHATALRWLRAENLSASQCRSIGVSTRLVSAEDVSKAMCFIQRLFSGAMQCRHRPGYRLIWILDEYQRIEALPKRVRDEINSSLHSVFNTCPTGLSLLLSFSGKPEPGNLPPWLTPELKSRIGRTKVMVLPPLQTGEAVNFVREVLAQFRTPGHDHRKEFFPFNKESCDVIIREVGKTGELKPRDIMSAFNAVMEQADPKIEAKEMPGISAEFAKEALKSYVNIASDQEQ